MQASVSAGSVYPQGCELAFRPRGCIFCCERLMSAGGFCSLVRSRGETALPGGRKAIPVNNLHKACGRQHRNAKLLSLSSVIDTIHTHTTYTTSWRERNSYILGGHKELSNCSHKGRKTHFIIIELKASMTPQILAITRYSKAPSYRLISTFVQDRSTFTLAQSRNSTIVATIVFANLRENSYF